jgi:hypothetical protein
VASELNAAILRMEEHSAAAPKLADLLRLVLWSQEELDRKKVKYPRMTDLATATIEPPKWSTPRENLLTILTSKFLE